MREKKLVYVPMAVDTVHPGHLNIIKVASQFGQVMVGLFTDEAIASYKRVPVMNYAQRKTVIENIKGVDVVVKQETRDYEPNLREYRPDYMVHGTDWREGPLADVRARAIEVMAEWGGEVVEPEYTKGVSSTEIHLEAKRDGVTSEQKRVYLKRLFDVKKFSRIMGVYNARTAQIAEQIRTTGGEGVKYQFDALWLDVEGVAFQKGIDESSLSESNIFSAVCDISINSEKPLIIPFKGGNRELFLRKAEQSGVSAIAVWDSNLGEQRETVSWLINHRNYQNMMILAIAEEATADVDTLGAEGYIFRRQKAEKETDKKELRGSIPVLIMNNLEERLEDHESVSGVIYESILVRLSDSCLQDVAESILKLDA